MCLMGTAHAVNPPTDLEVVPRYDGTITLETTVSNFSSNLTVTSGTLLNNGVINSDEGSGGARTISADLDNTGTVNINTNTTLSKNSGLYTNNVVDQAL